MLAFCVPYNDVGQRDEVISLSQRVLPWEITKAAGDNKKYFPGGNTGYANYVKKYHLDSIHYGEDIKAAEAQEFISQGAVNN